MTKKLEAEIIRMMDDYWASYFDGNLTHWANYLIDDYRNIGGTEEEIWNSKKEIVEYTYKVIDQIKGATELRNKQTRIIPYDPYIMVHELLDIYVKIESVWTFYQKFRLSSLIQKTDDGWKVLHQHGSYPDSKTTEGEAVAFDTLKSENKKLQKAINERTIELEYTNRELAIEAALERVRARTMAMQKSDELSETSFVLFEQFKALGETSDQISIGIFKEEQNVMELYSTLYGTQWKEPVRVDLEEPVVIKKIYTAWKDQEQSLVIDITGTDLRKYNDYRKKISGLDYKEKRWVVHIAFFSKGMLSFSTPQPHPTIQLLERFAVVFDGTYTRFLDLQKAEAQAREAQIQLALERIRSRSLAMHHSNELKDVVAILFQQLQMLGLEFDGGAAITLFSENSKDAAILVATPELTLPIQVNLPYDEEAFVKNPIILDVWNAKETGNDIFNRVYSFEEKSRYFDYVFKHNGLDLIPQLSRDFILKAESYTASFIAEKNSLLGANSWTQQLFSKNDFDILKRIAKVFEQAYIRFLDLQKAEALALRAEQDLIEIKAARKKAEDSLNELQITQKQLIQSEKMASLGELTAGIAHEIQNPLNFVNNFSEVNKELLLEMKEEIEKGNVEDAKALANDIIDNEEKINRHGKRADAIVKGMLQHSRRSSGVKEPTNINALCDEYLRLSYHGLRAKDKSFNATIKTDFDTSIGNINIIPQDIGRVVLNLLTNAFYVVNEKKTLRQAQGDSHYEPTVSISTKRIGDKVEVKVSDNGNGIPEKVMDKIFQPFFTTKPTGQGTGLGLSLSYDIVKAHGGDLKVETKESEGTSFIINLTV